MKKTVIVCDGCGVQLDGDMALLELRYVNGRRSRTTLRRELCDECVEHVVIRVPKRQRAVA